ncbi:MAG TPA: dihydrofolate reductase family protein [Candidatus Acidoferrum sp.]|nr:dihydrofolate reductase family protein [Candidatus Acidoferrum sp.]
MASSLDSYISRKDGSVDWLFLDQDYGMKEFFASVDVAVMGRKTYAKAQELSPQGVNFPGMKTFVFSHLLPKGKQENVEVISDSTENWLKSIRATPGKDIWLVGGGEMVREFLQKKLVNEIGISIHPRLLGDGIPLYIQPYPETELELIHSKAHPSGLLQVFYRVK